MHGMCASIVTQQAEGPELWDTFLTEVIEECRSLWEENRSTGDKLAARESY